MNLIPSHVIIEIDDCIIMENRGAIMSSWDIIDERDCSK